MRASPFLISAALKYVLISDRVEIRPSDAYQGSPLERAEKLRNQRQELSASSQGVPSSIVF
jgi:hypothetical protein